MDGNKANPLKRDDQTKDLADGRKEQVTFDLQQQADGDSYSISVPKDHPKAREIRALFEQMKEEKMTLRGCNIRFDEKDRGILIGDVLVPFRSTSLRSRLARILLEHPPGKRVSWDQIREHPLMSYTDTSPELTKYGIAVFKRKVTDAVDAINEKVQQVLNTNDILFSRDDNQIFSYFIRNF